MHGDDVRGRRGDGRRDFIGKVCQLGCHACSMARAVDGGHRKFGLPVRRGPGDKDVRTSSAPDYEPSQRWYEKAGPPAGCFNIP